jgi:membrane protease subunit HflC
MRTLFFLILGAVALVAVASAAYTVDRTEYVYVTQFGEHKVTHDGLTDGGLYWKWPWPVQSVQRLDRRLQYFDLPETEVLTRAGERFSLYRKVQLGGVVAAGPTGPLAVLPWLQLSADSFPDEERERNSIDKTISLVAYVCWRIAGQEQVDWFIRRVGTLDRARAILGDHIRGQLPAILGQKQMDDLISPEESRVDATMLDIRQRLMTSARARAEEGKYGIEIVDIRIRRTSHPVQVREAIFARIRSDRNQRAQRSRSEGESQATRIRSDADYQVRQLESQANAEKKELEKAAENERLRLLSDAYGKDPQFATVVKKVERIRKALSDSKSVLYLSAAHEFWDLLRPPGSNGPSRSTAEAAQSPANGKAAVEK